jgi:hypothetical protein
VSLRGRKTPGSVIKRKPLPPRPAP